MPLSHFIHQEKTICFGQMRNRERDFFFNFELIVIIIIANRGNVGRDDNIIMKID